MSTTYDAQGEKTQEVLNQRSRQLDTATKVHIRLMFLRVGEIDTLHEKYQAQVAIEARWLIDIDKLSSNLSSDDYQRLIEGKSISLLKYDESHWHPQLYIENAIGDLKEQIRFSAKKSKTDNQIYICEHRDIKGLFWEKLKLQHFPSDIQDLPISIGSILYDDKVILIADPYHLSGVNQEAFVDEQEWLLYKHVDTQQRYIKEFLFQATNHDDDDDDDDDDDEEVESTKNNEDRKRSVLTVTCHAARRSNYYFWNGYCLILLITLVSFCIFAIPANLTQNRVQTSCTLLLTSITFRWTVNRSLPTISYLTSLDIYAIMCIFSLVIQCIWHAIIGVVIFLVTPNETLTPSMWYTRFDRYVFIVMIVVFIIVHIALVIWLYLVPLKHRKNMAKKDIEYQLSMSKMNNNENNKTVSFWRIPFVTEI